MAIILNRTALAEHMGVSLITIDNWRKEGMPALVVGGKGTEWQFDIGACVKWYANWKAKNATAAAPDDLTQIEKRTASAKMQQAELALARDRKEVAPIAEFERAQAKVFAEIRANVMNVPQRVVIQLLGMTDEAKFKEVLRAELSLALQAAANAELTLADDEAEDTATDA